MGRDRKRKNRNPRHLIERGVQRLELQGRVLCTIFIDDADHVVVLCCRIDVNCITSQAHTIPHHIKEGVGRMSVSYQVVGSVVGDVEGGVAFRLQYK